MRCDACDEALISRPDPLSASAWAKNALQRRRIDPGTIWRVYRGLTAGDRHRAHATGAVGKLDRPLVPRSAALRSRGEHRKLCEAGQWRTDPVCSTSGRDASQHGTIPGPRRQMSSHDGRAVAPMKHGSDCFACLDRQWRCRGRDRPGRLVLGSSIPTATRAYLTRFEAAGEKAGGRCCCRLECASAADHFAYCRPTSPNPGNSHGDRHGDGMRRGVSYPRSAFLGITAVFSLRRLLFRSFSAQYASLHETAISSTIADFS
jgi:hypothetical protein